jgi:hypothetical protein
MDPNTIIDKSLPVLNEKGYQNVDLKLLLDNIKIKPKDFFSAFSDFDDLIVKIFYRLSEESDQLTNGIDQSTFSLENLFKSSTLSFDLQIKYRFFFFDLHTIINNNESIKDRYFELISLRKIQLIHLFNLLMEEGIFVKERFPGSFENLATQMTMLADSWLSHNQIVFGKGDFNLAYYSKLIFSMVMPYLTDRGLEDYKKILGYQKK